MIMIIIIIIIIMTVIIIPLCRMRGQKGESVCLLVSGCEKLAQWKIKKWRDNVAKIVHWNLSEV